MPGRPRRETNACAAWLRIRGRLLMAEAMTGLNKLQLPGFDLAEAKRLASSADRAVKSDQLGYALLVGELRS